MPKTIHISLGIVLLCWYAGLIPASAQQSWPIEPLNEEHPIGNSFGEFQYYQGKGSYHHQGVDILAKPMMDEAGEIDPSAPWVRAVAEGTVLKISDGAYFDNYMSVRGGDGITYKYVHLQNGSYDRDFSKGDRVAAGDRIAKVAREPYCGLFHHLHYEMIKDGNYLNPLASIRPNPDPNPPQIDMIGFAADDAIAGEDGGRWQVKPNGTKACTVLDGPIDIVVKGRDQDNAGSSFAGTATLWFYNLRWRACPDLDPDCTWQTTHVFDQIPVSWGKANNQYSSAYYSRQSPWKSGSWYCEETWIYGIATNFVNGRPNIAGNWDTTGIADGAYSVSVEATDFSGNQTIHTRRVCVQNEVNCLAELTIRNGTDDDGAIPYPGLNWQQSPDITANSGAPDEDQAIRVGRSNTVAITVWNYGSCDLTAGSTYQVCLGWASASNAVAHPLPDDQIINCQTESISDGGWPPGSSRVTEFNWTPPPGSLPRGDHFLVAWVDMPADPVSDSPAVNRDDNRAAQLIVF